MFKKNPQLNKNKGNKSAYRGKPGEGQFSIRRVNENQQGVLMIIVFTQVLITVPRGLTKKMSYCQE